MKHLKLVFLLLLFLGAIGCAKYDEDLDCYHVPSWRNCDSWDYEPTDFTLSIQVVTNDDFPIPLKIYNRTLLAGIGSLHANVSANQSMNITLPNGRYTAIMQFSNDSTVVQDFRVYSSSKEYCEGVCYQEHNASIKLIDPGN